MKYPNTDLATKTRHRKIIVFMDSSDLFNEVSVVSMQNSNVFHKGKPFFLPILTQWENHKSQETKENNTNVLLLLNSKNSSVYFVNESSLPNIINNSIWLSWHTQEGRLLLLKINIEASAQLLWPEMELRVQVEYGFSFLS